mmetsp:Transcript_53135/g.159015  ORF Transcript_53135/g.159015 Transcript_53135/m.159015 type:complete len:249 (-) Transcript_53135:508-1254(-)
MQGLEVFKLFQPSIPVGPLLIPLESHVRQALDPHLCHCRLAIGPQPLVILPLVMNPRCQGRVGGKDAGHIAVAMGSLECLEVLEAVYPRPVGRAELFHGLGVITPVQRQQIVLRAVLSAPLLGRVRGGRLLLLHLRVRICAVFHSHPGRRRKRRDFRARRRFHQSHLAGSTNSYRSLLLLTCSVYVFVACPPTYWGKFSLQHQRDSRVADATGEGAVILRKGPKRRLRRILELDPRRESAIIFHHLRW